MKKHSSAAAAPAIDIKPQHLKIVQDIVRICLPAESKIYVVGSRVKGKAQKGSDLDLAIDAKRALTQEERNKLAVAFTESDLPYTVDCIDMRDISENFKASLRKHKLPLPLA